MGELLRPDPVFFNSDYSKQNSLHDDDTSEDAICFDDNSVFHDNSKKHVTSCKKKKRRHDAKKSGCNSFNTYNNKTKKLTQKELDIKKKKEKAYRIIKRGFDIATAGSAIAIGSPVFLLIALMVKASDGGQPIYSQERLGKDGTHIRIYKFRSMRVDAEDLKDLLSPKQRDQFYNEYKIDNDPRVTKIGRLLRKSSIDELPQLFNVLDGDMTLIGPRPIVKGEVKQYGKKVEKLLSVKPGLTGYWQAYARNKATYKSGARQRMELFYVDHRSLTFDFKILLKTVISVINQEGAQ